MRLSQLFQINKQAHYNHETKLLSPQLNSNNFARHGFEDIRDAEQWIGNSCGINCLQMVLSHSLLSIPSLKNLCDISKSYEAYDEEKGWLHNGLILIAKRYGVRGKKTIIKKAEDLVAFLHSGALIVASVKTDVSNASSHLLLIYGIEHIDKTYLFIHNPGTSNLAPEFNQKIEVADFMKSATGRAILFPCKNSFCLKDTNTSNDV